MSLIEANIDFSDENDTLKSLDITKELLELREEIKKLLKTKITMS